MNLDQKKIRKYHYFLLLSLIQEHGQVSRSQLSELTQMSNTSVGKVIKELIEDELVIEVGSIKGEVGRRAMLLEINPDGAYIIGVQIDLDIVRIGLVSLNGTILETKKVSCNLKKQPEKSLEKIAIHISQLIDEFSEQVKDKIVSIGVSMPGLVSWPDGEVLSVPQFDWEKIDVKSFLEERLKQTVYIDNHVRIVLLAEKFFGRLKNYEDIVCLYIGSGVGSAVMVKGEIMRGYNNTLGEIGHTTLDPDGSLCDCGRLGCLQTFVSSNEIEKQTERKITEVAEAYDRGEEWAVKMIERARKYLKIAISNVICTYSPEAVLLAGPMIKKFPILAKDIDSSINDFIWDPLKDSFQIITESIGEESGVIGASSLVLKEFLRYVPMSP